MGRTNISWMKEFGTECGREGGGVVELPLARQKMWSDGWMDELHKVSAPLVLPSR
jgi:hypothetical protein